MWYSSFAKATVAEHTSHVLSQWGAQWNMVNGNLRAVRLDSESLAVTIVNVAERGSVQHCTCT